MDIRELFRLGMDRSIPLPFAAPEGPKLNLGAGNKMIPGAVPLDLPEWDADKDAIPHPDNSVGEIFAFHFLEHCARPVDVLLECQRVLKPGGVMNIVVPYYTSQMAAHDLDHKHQFCEETWRVLFGNPYYDKNRVEWKFQVGINIIVGVVERNLCLLTQLRKEAE